MLQRDMSPDRASEMILKTKKAAFTNSNTTLAPKVNNDEEEENKELSI